MSVIKPPYIRMGAERNDPLEGHAVFPDGFHNFSLERKQQILSPEFNIGDEVDFEHVGLPRRVRIITENENNVEIQFLTDKGELTDEKLTISKDDFSRNVSSAVEALDSNMRKVESVAPAIDDPLIGQVLETESHFKRPEEINTNWRGSEEWKGVESSRNIYVQEKVKNLTSSEGDDQKENIAESNYKLAKDALVLRIRQDISIQMAGQGEAEIRARINEVLFDELVVAENKLYLEALKAERGQTFGDKAKEAAKNLLNNKVGRWYLGLSREKKLAVGFLLGSAAGSFLGATASAGVGTYLAWRGLRTASSYFGINEANKQIDKRWTIDDINKKEEEAIQQLKNEPVLSLEEKEKGYADIKQEAKKARLKLTALKIGVSVGVGGLTSLAGGIFENATVKLSDSLNRMPKGSNFNGQKIEVDPNEVTYSDVEKVKMVEPTTVDGTPIPKEPTQIPYSEVDPTKPSVEDPLKGVFAGRVLENMEQAKHIPKSGDSVWSLLRKTLENNSDFKKLEVGRQNILLGEYVEDFLKNPKEYGEIGNDGTIYIGKPVDFGKLLTDQERFATLLEKAEKMDLAKLERLSVVDGEANKALDSLNKTELPKVQKPETPVLPEQLQTEINETLDNLNKVKAPSLSIEEKIKLLRQQTLELQNNKTLSPKDLKLEQDRINSEIDKLLMPAKEQMQKLQNSLVENNNAVNFDRDAAETELIEAKQRLGVLEGGKSSIRSMSGDIESVNTASITDIKIQEALSQDLDRYFGKKGILGGIKEGTGIKSREWPMIRNLSYAKLEKLYTGDSNMSGLTPSQIAEIGKSSKIKDFFDHIKWLQAEGKKSGIDMVLFSKDASVEGVVKKIGGKLLESRPSLDTLQRAA